MREKRRRPHREKDLTRQYLEGGFDADDPETAERFSARSKHAQQNKILRTAEMRAQADGLSRDIESLPLGEVIQVFSLFSEVDHDGARYLCTVRKTLSKVSETQIVVGDRVRFRPTGTTHETGIPEAVIEQLLPRQTVLTRADSFKAAQQHPIVANARQMLIVASLWAPFPRWGLIDRMIIAAQAGGLQPIVCLNKIDLADAASEARQQAAVAEQALPHYESLGITTLRTSAEAAIGIESLRQLLRGQVTVLAGHSGVGKSSLIRAIEPQLDIKVGDVSTVHLKGKHTTTSARRYELSFGATVIDTPGVKLFGLWGVTADNLDRYFPDVAAGNAPPWRVQSYQRIADSLRR